MWYPTQRIRTLYDLQILGKGFRTPKLVMQLSNYLANQKSWKCLIHLGHVNKLASYCWCILAFWYTLKESLDAGLWKFPRVIQPQAHHLQSCKGDYFEVFSVTDRVLSDFKQREVMLDLCSWCIFQLAYLWYHTWKLRAASLLNEGSTKPWVIWCF